MATLKDNWKETGKDLGHAFSGLGKTLIKTAKKAVDKAEDWACGDGTEQTSDAASGRTANNDTDSNNK